MAPASASLLPAAGAKRPFAADSASDAAEHPLAQDGKKSGQTQSQQQPKLECPRCSSSDTKFCYYNNYSTTQPRHYCRTCRRYWTHGGTLRNVPVGGACRRGFGSSKRRRPSAEPHTPSSESPPQPDLQDPRPPLPVFPFLTDGGPVFLPQLDLVLGGFPWTTLAATDHLYDMLTAPWGGCDGALAPHRRVRRLRRPRAHLAAAASCRELTSVIMSVSVSPARSRLLFYHRNLDRG